ncbi:hypothetical protein DAY19_02260 [Halobacteriovorax vibrionivorans]|uniref:VCBS repeat-containing protein n=1 Tax=Halobacteriovorax vibrionivorans TaxID=2152716 RepID=A0ABY0IJ17_9BACT|nr:MULTISPECIES: hypothetical protein [Halobacteriovorax]RZF22617.1 hypothetical protein DAY19_02260 [Halobacteriovorax vibrionivorans]TGD47837.1 hypothetical protein EP118_06355 [Halobacteriovorax sp. Y22]
MLSIKRILAFSALLPLVSVNAQDAWLFKEYYDAKNEKKEVSKDKDHYVKKSALYQIDLNGDFRREYIGTKIVDGIPHLTIYNINREQIFNYKFPISGFDSYIYRIRRRKINSDKMAILFYLYDGKTSYIDKYGSSSLWAMVVENGSLKNLEIKELGKIWTENTDNYGHYKRAHHVNFKDVNSDGQLDLIISSGSVHKYFSHIKGVKWRNL